MAPNNDGPRRDSDRAEDNPFIAWRRFADSQVSSLLNTVVTLPATLANFNNAYHAREQCLFGRADKTKCDTLHHLEVQIAQLRSEGRELYKVGDLQAVLKKGEELMQLDRRADELRRDIVESARTGAGEQSEARRRTELVEKVANEKGQQWGWSWDWGFPRPFDADDAFEPDRRRERCRRWRRRREESIARPEEDEWQRFSAKWDALRKEMEEEQPRAAEGEHGPKVWKWSFSWPPPPADAGTPTRATSERQAFDELGHMIAEEVNRIMALDPFNQPENQPRDPAFAYSPRSLEEDREMSKAGIQWRDAFEDLLRAERGEPLIPAETLGQSANVPYRQWARRFHKPMFAGHDAAPQRQSEYPKPVPWEGEETREEPSYEYGHDHEDQHDDPPTPKVRQGQWCDGMPETERDAYERLFGPASAPSAPVNEDRPSVLSTLTTTERTVAPDGSVTTKVILKKRFADGREESSETMHTQRGQEKEAHQDPWKAMQDAQASSTKKDVRKKGWFWSS